MSVRDENIVRLQALRVYGGGQRIAADKRVEEQGAVSDLNRKTSVSVISEVHNYACCSLRPGKKRISTRFSSAEAMRRNISKE